MDFTSHLVRYILDSNFLFSCDRNVPRAKQPFYDVYVFVVGGGTYTEYHNLLQWSRAGANTIGGSGSGIGGSVAHGSSSSLNALGLSFPGSGSGSDLTSPGSSGIPGVGSTRRITYGGTEILTPKIFLEQVSYTSVSFVLENVYFRIHVFFIFSLPSLAMRRRIATKRHVE